MKKPIKMSYDETDLRIIEEIRDNARISYKNLSEAVNLSVPAVFERMKKMEERGVIQGYKTAVDYCRIGYPIHVFILLHDDRCRDGVPYMLSQMESIFQFWIVSGEYDYLLEVYLSTSQELEDLLNELYKIGRTHTMLILNKLKEDSL